MEHRFKTAKSDGFSPDFSPHLFEPPTQVNSSVTNEYAPENDHITRQQVQRPALQEQVSPTSEVNMTLFHWQIQQETRRVGGISPELLSAQDGDGDTYVFMERVFHLDQQETAGSDGYTLDIVHWSNESTADGSKPDITKEESDNMDKSLNPVDTT